jgi:AsmA-like C-terminal region
MQSRVKSVLKWMFITLLALVIGITAALLIFKDRIVQQVILEVNKSLNVSIEVSKVDLDFFHGFPNVSIAFNDVVLPANGEFTFLEAKRLYAVVNPIQIVRGNLDIDRIEVVSAKVSIYINEQNENNFSKIFKVQDDPVESTEQENATFTLRAILLKDSKLEYHNATTGSTVKTYIKRIEGNLSLDEAVYTSRIFGSFSMQELESRNWQIKRDRELTIDLNIKFNTANQELAIEESVIRHEGASFNVDGKVMFQDVSDYDLEINGEDLDFKLLESFLPGDFEKVLRKFKGSGSIDFSTKLRGVASSTRLPALTARLRLTDVNLTDESFNANVNKLSLTADLHFDDIGNLSTGSVEIKDAQGFLQNSQFEMRMAIDNFNRPKYRGGFKGSIPTTWLMANLKLPYYESGKGNVDINLTASGVYDRAGKLGESSLGGSFSVNDVSFRWADSVTIDNINGLVQLDGDKLSIANLKLKWLNSDVTINGSMEDIRPTWGNPVGNFLLKSDVRSNNLAVEDIVTLIRNAPKISDSVSTTPYNLDLELIGQFDHLSFKRYHGADVAGEIIFQDDILEVVDLTSKGMGGAMKINGKLKIMVNKDIYISANALTKGVYLDSLFYIFNNFDQQFITAENLKGLLYADVFASMYFDSTWRFRRKLLTSMAKVRIVDGQLNDFEPLMALSTYIDDKDDNLSNLKFSHLVNHITIRADTIYIPEMSIHTNVRNIALGGYHTLSQRINYRLAVPIINERVDKDEEFGAVQKSSKGSPNLLFRITGTTADYRVSYDVLRATGNVLKLLDITKIFKKKEEIPIDSTFLDDEEFDWKN